MTTRHPDWFQKHTEPLFNRIASLNPFPFDQPADYTGFFRCHLNDYLRLSDHPEVIAAANAALSATGSGALASAAFLGDHGYHHAFKSLIAKAACAQGPESVVLTTCGWTANVGLIEAIASPDIPVYIDINAHASLWDGARLAGARMIPLRHNDPKSIRLYAKRFGPGVIVIDAFYSTHGSVCPLEEYVQAAKETNCLLVLDEAHSFGLVGQNGGGLAVERGLASEVPLRTVSIAKGLGGHGGFIVADPQTATYLTMRMRPVIFSSSPLPSTSAGSARALEIIMREPERMRVVQKRAAQLRSLLNDRGVDTGPSACQIVSLHFDTEDAACKLYGELRNRKILFSVFLAPAVPKDTGLARFSIYYGLSENDINHIAENIIDAMHKLNIRSQFPGRRKPL